MKTFPARLNEIPSADHLSVPTIFVWGRLIYVQLFGYGGSFAGLVMWMIGLSFIAFTTCVAMAIFRSGSFEWRIAALFNSSRVRRCTLGGSIGPRQVTNSTDVSLLMIKSQLISNKL